MKTRKLISFALCIAFLAIYLSAFKSPVESPSKNIQKNYHNYLTEFDKEISNFLETTKNLQDSRSSIKKLQTDFLQLRREFKEVSFLLEYFAAQSTKDHINGAPLPRIERNAGQLNVFEPEGLQTIDEFVFSENPYAEKDALIKLTEKLKLHYSPIFRYEVGRLFSDREVFEAARFGIIRMYTLGVSGFDSPASKNSIEEAKIVIEEIFRTIKLYNPLLEARNSDVGEKLEIQFKNSIQYLATNNDFDSFNRLEFLKDHVNPIFKLLLEAQQALYIETIYEVTPAKQSNNYLATNLFAIDFINKYYYSSLNNTIDNEKVRELGRLLFFDPILSANNMRSCASCHNPKLAFTDGKKKSDAFDGNSSVSRNSPTIINAVYADKYFHDMRASVLDDQFEHVILSEDEFNTNYKEILAKLNASKEYRALFKEAFPQFGKQNLEKHTFKLALVAYVTSLSGFNSEFDQYVRGEIPAIAKEVERGYNIFMGKASCGTCHFAPTFNGTVPPLYQESESEVLGVPATTDTINAMIDSDLGRRGNKNPKEEVDFYYFSFKTPTIRNIALTAPYMHNGVYETLEEVVDFYDVGGGVGLGFEVPYQTLPFDNLSLTEQEKADLVSFMEALTDTTGLTAMPTELPKFENKPEWNNRPIGGLY